MHYSDRAEITEHQKETMLEIQLQVWTAAASGQYISILKFHIYLFSITIDSQKAA